MTNKETDYSEKDRLVVQQTMYGRRRTSIPLTPNQFRLWITEVLAVGSKWDHYTISKYLNGKGVVFSAQMENKLEAYLDRTDAYEPSILAKRMVSGPDNITAVETGVDGTARLVMRVSPDCYQTLISNEVMFLVKPAQCSHWIGHGRRSKPVDYKCELCPRSYCRVSIAAMDAQGVWQCVGSVPGKVAWYPTGTRCPFKLTLRELQPFTIPDLRIIFDFEGLPFTKIATILTCEPGLITLPELPRDRMCIPGGRTYLEERHVVKSADTNVKESCRNIVQTIQAPIARWGDTKSVSDSDLEKIEVGLEGVIITVADRTGDKPVYHVSVAFRITSSLMTLDDLPSVDFNKHMDVLLAKMTNELDYLGLANTSVVNFVPESVMHMYRTLQRMKMRDKLKNFDVYLRFFDVSVNNVT